MNLTHYRMNCFLWRSLLAYTWIKLTISPVLSGFQPPNSTQVLLQPSSTRLWLKPHPPINKLAIVTALSRQPRAQINASPSEMGAVQGKRTVFSTRLCIGGQQWPTQSQPRCFQSGAQRWPCCLHPSGAPTHLPLSRPFCWSRTYLQRSLQEVMSQDESFMPDISGYIRERVKMHACQIVTICLFTCVGVLAGECEGWSVWVLTIAPSISHGLHWLE